MVLQHNRMNENGMAASSDIAVSNLLLWDVIYLRTAVLFGPFIHIDYVSYTSKKVLSVYVYPGPHPWAGEDLTLKIDENDQII